MKRSRKAISAILLAGILLFSVILTPSASLADKSTGVSLGESIAACIQNKLNRFIDILGKGLVLMFPDSVLVKDADDFVPDDSFSGTDDFISTPVQGAKWSLGYAQASILPEDFGKGVYYKGGYALNKSVTECLDDLKVRTIVLSDGSGRGAVAIATVDCIGLANHDVQLIRESLTDYADNNGIVSINVTSTHTHSGIDTQGVYTDLFKAIAKNLIACTFNTDKLEPSINPVFLNTIIEKTKSCIIAANENMKSGTLKYAVADVSKYVRDRTAPMILDTSLSRLIFTPDDGSKATLIASMGVHPEGVGYVRDVISSDFVYYTEKVLNSFGYNFMFIQGKLGTYTEVFDASSDGLDLGDRADEVIRYGEEIGYILAGMTMSEDDRIAICDKSREDLGKTSDKYTPWYEGLEVSDERELQPILNVKSEQFLVKITNPLYALLAKVAIAENDVFKKDREYYSSTEVGYMEIGDLKCVLCPGETYAELQYGGENMVDFDYPAICDKLDGDILIFDLMNDAVGYIMPDSYFTYLNVYYDKGLEITDAWGLTSVGNNAASQIYGKFYKLYDTVR